MTIYVIADPHLGGYYKTFVRRVASIQDAKHWKREGAAVAEARLLNVNRNIPPGQAPSKHYQSLPNVEVHEIDAQWNVVNVIPAPPEYININLRR